MCTDATLAAEQPEAPSLYDLLLGEGPPTDREAQLQHALVLATRVVREHYADQTRMLQLWDESVQRWSDVSLGASSLATRKAALQARLALLLYAIHHEPELARRFRPQHTPPPLVTLDEDAAARDAERRRRRGRVDAFGRGVLELGLPAMLPLWRSSAFERADGFLQSVAASAAMFGGEPTLRDGA